MDGEGCQVKMDATETFTLILYFFPTQAITINLHYR